MTIADTPEAREAAARRYVTALPILQQMVAPIVAAVGRADAAHLLMREINEALIEGLYVRLMVLHFTLSELEAMVAFYSSPEWRSAVPKMERFQLELGAAIKPEIDRATRAALGR